MRKGWAAIGLGALVLASPAIAGGAAGDLPQGVKTHVTEEGLTLVDATGKPIYRLDTDRIIKRRPEIAATINARCGDVCARIWRPMAPPAGFTAAGDWGVIQRNGAAQLTYKGDPLYHFAGKSMDEAKLPIAPPYLAGYTAKAAELRDGVPMVSMYWHEALYQPAAPKPELPAGVSVKWSKTAYVYNSGDQPLYEACSSACDGLHPFAAPMTALPVGAWRPVEDKSGQRYWSYKGRMVYAAREATPEAANPGWRKLTAH